VAAFYLDGMTKPRQKSTEMFITNPRPGESPDLDLSRDLLDPEDVAEIEALRTKPKKEKGKTDGG
jgi:hypothetical protein